MVECAGRDEGVWGEARADESISSRRLRVPKSRGNDLRMIRECDSHCSIHFPSQQLQRKRSCLVTCLMQKRVSSLKRELARSRGERRTDIASYYMALDREHSLFLCEIVCHSEEERVWSKMREESEVRLLRRSIGGCLV